MWQKLSDVYEQRSDSSIHMLQQRWYGAMVEGNDNIATYIAKLEDLAHRLNLLGEQIPESMIITKILMTLPTSYRHFVSAWESSPTAERTLVNLTSRLMIEESRTATHELNEARAFAARANGRKQRGKFNQRSSTVTSDKCFECNETGHWARQCPKRKTNRNAGGNGARGNNNNSNNSKPKPQGQSFVSEAFSSNCGSGIGVKDWVLDSGASDHMCNEREWFTTYETLIKPTAVRIGDGSYINAYGKGYMNIKMFDGTNWNVNHLANVLYVPELKCNLFSVGAALDKGLKMASTQSVCKIMDGDRTVAVGARSNKLYLMQFEISNRSRSRIRRSGTRKHRLSELAEELAREVSAPELSTRQKGSQPLRNKINRHR